VADCFNGTFSSNCIKIDTCDSSDITTFDTLNFIRSVAGQSRLTNQRGPHGVCGSSLSQAVTRDSEQAFLNTYWTRSSDGTIIVGGLQSYTPAFSQGDSGTGGTGSSYGVSSSVDSMGTIIGIVAGVGTGILLIVIIAVLYRRHKILKTRTMDGNTYALTKV